MKKINFNTTTKAMGRNGLIIQAGIEIMKNAEEITLSPINSRGYVSNCFLEIPTENIREVAATLIAIADELNLPGGEEKTVGGWTVQDVTHAAEEMDVELTEEQAEEIFESIENNFDASIGINWDTVENAINQHFSTGDQD